MTADEERAEQILTEIAHHRARVEELQDELFEIVQRSKREKESA